MQRRSYCTFIWLICLQLVLAQSPPRDPSIPSFTELESLANISFDELEKTILPFNSNSIKYYYKGQYYAGWAIKQFDDTEHKFRFFYFQAGSQVRQIGYYNNGNVGHDFNFKNDKSYGSERMWRSDGSPYVDNYYSQPGVMHGKQYRWHPDNQLAMKSYYDNGLLCTKISYDIDGMITSEYQIPN